MVKLADTSTILKINAYNCLLLFLEITLRYDSKAKVVQKKWFYGLLNYIHPFLLHIIYLYCLFRRIAAILNFLWMLYITMRKERGRKKKEKTKLYAKQ